MLEYHAENLPHRISLAMHDFFELTICMPIIPEFTPEAHLSDYFNKGLEDILTLNNLEIDIPDIGKYNLNVLKLTDDSFKDIFHYSHTILVFQIRVPNDAEKTEISSSDNNPISLEERVQIYKAYIVDEFKYQSFHLLVLSNISFPGAIKTWEGVVLLNREKYSSFPSVSSIHRESLDDIIALKWPTYTTVPILQVWEWYQSNNFSFRSHSKTKVARSLNTFTYLFKKNSTDIVFDLFWSIIGIEALYCTSKEGISEQIYEKVQLVLGPVTESKKKIKAMYNFRSRLVHGDLDIPPNYFDYEDIDEEKFQKEIFEATILAVAILTTTLQQLIIKNETDLKFKYILE